MARAVFDRAAGCGWRQWSPSCWRSARFRVWLLRGARRMTRKTCLGGGLSLSTPLLQTETLALGAGAKGSASSGVAGGSVASLSQDAEAYSADPVPVNTIGDTYGTSGAAQFLTNSFGTVVDRDAFTFVGPYQFNIAGNTVVRGKTMHWLAMFCMVTRMLKRPWDIPSPALSDMIRQQGSM